MNTNFLLRFGLALISVLAPLWIMAQMPSSSAFAVSLQGAQFDLWQGLLVASSLSISLVMAGFLVRS